MKVLSLFDGMACGMLAFLSAGLPVDRYVAFEIDKYAVQTSTHNFPMIEHRGDVFQADFTEFFGFDFVLAGFPCTKFSIAQKNDRETEPYSGEGWLLFEQAWRAVCEAKPKYFLFENNKSMAKAVQKEISRIIGFEPICINSALVSAQNRQRLYWVGKRNADGTYSRVNVEQPEDRGILLKDVLDRIGARELSDREMAYMVRRTSNGRNHFDFNYHQDATKDKGACLTANISKGVPYNVCCEPVPAIPINITEDGKSQTIKAQYHFTSIPNICCYKSTYGATGVAIPTDKPPSEQFSGSGKDRYAMKRVYEVKDGFITIRGEKYPINLPDGNYIFRKLTVIECKRLQTVPEWYEFPVSDTQAYKMLGNGWTVEVIAHLINATQEGKPEDEPEGEQMNLFKMVGGLK